MAWLDVDGRDLKRLKQTFATFLDNLSEETESGGAAAGKFETNLVDEKTITIETCDGVAVKLGPLPYEPDDMSEVVEIYIQFALTVRKRERDGTDRYIIVKSATEVVYLQVIETDNGQESRRRVQGLHFDFDLFGEQENGENGTYDANHPIFHAQYNPNCIDTVAFDRWELPENDRSFPEYPRIPCAPFDIVAVGYMILNDHLPHKVIDNAGWPSQDILDENLPQFPEQAFEQAMPGTLHSEAWYIHHCTDPDGRPLIDPNNHRHV